MQLQPRAPVPPPSDDLATTLRVAAETLGHRPAVTVLRPDRRDEQGVASLRQWAAKTAHWLAIEHGLGAGDRIALLGPPGWVPVAACLGAWWAGVTVVMGGDGDVALVHEGTGPSPAPEAVSWGGAVDGSPLGASDLEPYAIAVQAFPDQPPASDAAPRHAALEIDGRTWSHAELLDVARGLPDGTLGLGSDAPATVWVPALAVHPLTSGRPTVLLDGATRDAAAGERVDSWLSSDAGHATAAAGDPPPPPDETGPRS